MRTVQALIEYILQSQLWDRCDPENFDNARKKILRGARSRHRRETKEPTRAGMRLPHHLGRAASAICPRHPALRATPEAAKKLMPR